jgi:hypothetical protein
MKNHDEIFWTWILACIILFILAIIISGSNQINLMHHFLYGVLFINLAMGTTLISLYFKIESDIEKAHLFILNRHRHPWRMTIKHTYSLKTALIWFGLCIGIVILSYIISPNIIHAFLASLITVLIATGYVMAVLLYNYYIIHREVLLLSDAAQEKDPLKRKAKSHKINYPALESAGFTELDKTKDMMERIYKV